MSCVVYDMLCVGLNQKRLQKHAVNGEFLLFSIQFTMMTFRLEHYGHRRRLSV